MDAIEASKSNVHKTKFLTATIPVLAETYLGSLYCLSLCLILNHVTILGTTFDYIFFLTLSLENPVIPFAKV